MVPCSFSSSEVRLYCFFLCVRRRGVVSCSSVVICIIHISVMLFFASNLITVRFAHVTHITHITHTTRVTHILRITPNKGHSLLPDHNHLVTERQELYRVRRQHARSPSQLLPNALVEQSVAHARVHRRQRVVQQHNVRVGITAARQ